MYLMGNPGRRGLGASVAQTATGSAPAAVAPVLSLAVQGGAISAGAATGIGIGVALLVAVISDLLAKHAQRAADAKNENQAADSASMTFDQAIQQIVQAYNGGSVTAAQCVSQLQALQQAMYSTLRSKVGPPGTAWTSSPPSPGAGTPCNKGCTVGCCVYYNDLLPGITMCTQALNALGGSLSSAQTVAAGMPAFNNQPAQANGASGICTSFTFTIEAIAKSKYSDYTRPAYQVTLTQPPASAVSSGLTSLVGGSAEVGGSSLLPLLGIGLLAFLVLR